MSKKESGPSLRLEGFSAPEIPHVLIPAFGTATIKSESILSDLFL